MNNLGIVCLIASFSLLLFSIFQTSYGIWKKNDLAIEIGRYTLLANLFLVFLAFMILITQLARMDLTNYYVVMHSSSDLPLFYRVTSIWAGSSGSLLFWNLLLNLFTSIALWQSRDSKIERIPVMHLILASLSCFLTYLAIFYDDAQPFREFVPAAAVGRGLNPLLQHWAMIIHPPLLYVGYVGFAVPFAIGMSALITGNLSADWLKSIRRWSIFSWFFLGTGILLGSKWAYEELGWGGYWAWDPVENASLMPWILASAFIHSLVIQERRGMLKFWNMLLIILTYHFTLLGTWITRSGVLEGPHSFSRSSIGIPFIVFILVSLTIFLMILVYRKDELKPERDLEAITSKEGSFLLNNFILIMACFVILLGVFSPVLYGKEFKAPWYNAWGIPAGIILLLLMGAAPLLAWRKGADSVFFTTLIKPLLFGIASAAFYGIFYSKFFTQSDYAVSDKLGEIYSVITIGLSGFTFAGIAQEYHRGIKARREQFTEENYFKAGFNMLMRNKRRYGGYIVHFSIVMIFVGLAGNAFKQNTSIKYYYHLENTSGNEIIYRGYDKGMLGDYQIEASTIKIKPIINGDETSSPNVFNVIVSEEASYKVKRQLSASEEMITERRFYPQINHLSGGFETQIPTSEPAINSSPKEDLYIQLGAIENASLTSENPDLSMLFMEYFFGARSFEEKSAFFQKFPREIIGNLEIWINPLVKLIWYGSVLYFLAGLFILLPIGEGKKA